MAAPIVKKVLVYCMTLVYRFHNNKMKHLVKQQEDKIYNVVKIYVNQTYSGYENHITDESVCQTSSDENKTVCSENLNEKIEEYQKAKPIEVIGDNLDVCISPAKMTADKQRRSLHWFLIMVIQRRVTYEDLNVQSDACQTPILDISTHLWIPSKEHMDSVSDNFVFHKPHTLLKYVKFLEPVKESYPSYIPHTFMDITKEKSLVLNCDLIDASKNSSQGMIEILQKVKGTVIQKVVFGDDVLTNERILSAQEAMQNNNSPYDCLSSIIHRPEGLHRQFNFLQLTHLRQCRIIASV